MRRISSYVGLTAIMFLVSAVHADDTKKTDTKKDPPKTTKVISKPVKADSFTGKLIRVEGAQRMLAVRVTAKFPQENAGAAQNLANLKLQLLTTRDPNSIRNLT